MAQATASQRDPAAAGIAARQLIWDLPLRTVHWGLVASVIGSFTTHYVGPAAFEWHVRFGYATLLLVVFRVLWGFAGTRHARFRQIARSLLPRAERGGPGAPVAAHTALGALMALLLLALLLAQTLTGLFSNDEVMNAGPLAGWIGLRRSSQVSDWHETVSNLILGALALHVGAALYYRFRRADDRITPLVTGYKSGLPVGAAITGQRLLLAGILAAALAAALYGVLSIAPPPLDLAP